MAVTVAIRKAMNFYEKQVRFNRNSNSSETITLGVPQGHKPNSPFVKGWAIVKKNGYNSDMIFSMGIQDALELGPLGAQEFKTLVPRKNAKTIPKPKKKAIAKPKAKAIPKPKPKVSNSKKPAAKKTNSKAKAKK
jgi:hypothetical protein